MTNEKPWFIITTTEGHEMNLYGPFPTEARAEEEMERIDKTRDPDYDETIRAMTVTQAIPTVDGVVGDYPDGFPEEL